MKRTALLAVGLLLAFPVMSLRAGYKPRTWEIKARETYPASLTSEGVTIAVEPLYTDKLASRAFDKDDMVARGIMPLAIIVFNDNDFPVEIDGPAIELIRGRDRIRTIGPEEAVARLFRKKKGWLPTPVPRLPKSQLTTDALYDFEAKFLMDKIIGPKEQGYGFLYMPIRNPRDLASYLSESTVYIPNIYRLDNTSRMIFFEIALDAALR